MMPLGIMKASLQEDCRLDPAQVLCLICMVSSAMGTYLVPQEPGATKAAAVAYNI